MTAQELINFFYNPFRNITPTLSFSIQWGYARQRAIEHCDLMIKELKMLHKPEYTTFITKYAVYKPGSTRAEEEAETMDGYERIAFYETLKAEIEAL